jgi:CRP-like cAMP-binding protein
MAISRGHLLELNASPFLTALEERDLDPLAAAMDEVRFARDARLYEQGAAGEAMHLILEGHVGVVRAGAAEGPRAAKTRPVDRILAVVGPGECVGEMALIDGEPRSATVVAVDDVVSARLTRAGYAALRADDPRRGIRLALGLFRLLSQRIRQVNKSFGLVHERMFSI